MTIILYNTSYKYYTIWSLHTEIYNAELTIYNSNEQSHLQKQINAIGYTYKKKYYCRTTKTNEWYYVMKDAKQLTKDRMWEPLTKMKILTNTKTFKKTVQHEATYMIFSNNTRLGAWQ